MLLRIIESVYTAMVFLAAIAIGMAALGSIIYMFKEFSKTFLGGNK